MYFARYSVRCTPFGPAFVHPGRPVSEENVKNKPKKLAKPLKAAAQIGGANMETSKRDTKRES